MMAMSMFQQKRGGQGRLEQVGGWGRKVEEGLRSEGPKGLECFFWCVSLVLFDMQQPCFGVTWATKNRMLTLSCGYFQEPRVETFGTGLAIHLADLKLLT